jgi:hypothetical protein
MTCILNNIVRHAVNTLPVKADYEHIKLPQVTINRIVDNTSKLASFPKYV